MLKYQFAVIVIDWLRVDDCDRLVRHLGQQGVEGRDQDIDREGGADPGVGGGDAGKRVPADAEKGRGAERDENQVAGVRSHAGEPADQDDDEGEPGARGDGHQLADQRGHHPGLLSHANADHGDEDDGDDAEAREVAHERGEDEADAFDRQEAAHVDRDLLQDVIPGEFFDVAITTRFGRDGDLDRLVRSPGDGVHLDRPGGGHEHLFRDADVSRSRMADRTMTPTIR